MKTINKEMTNGEIYSYAIGMSNHLTDNESYMPAMIAFGIQKNKTLLTSLGEDIEKSRMSIIQHYSISQEGENYTIDPNCIDKANKELSDLLSIVQEVKIYTCKISELEDVKLTSAQMQCLMFMIDEEETAE